MFRQFVEALMAPRGQLQRWLEQVCRQHAWSPSRQLKDQSQELVAVCSSMRVCVKERLCLCGNLCDYNLGKKKNPEAAISGILWHFHSGGILAEAHHFAG